MGDRRPGLDSLTASHRASTGVAQHRSTAVPTSPPAPSTAARPPRASARPEHTRRAVVWCGARSSSGGLLHCIQGAHTPQRNVSTPRMARPHEPTHSCTHTARDTRVRARTHATRLALVQRSCHFSSAHWRASIFSDPPSSFLSQKGTIARRDHPSTLVVSLSPCLVTGARTRPLTRTRTFCRNRQLAVRVHIAVLDHFTITGLKLLLSKVHSTCGTLLELGRVPTCSATCSIFDRCVYSRYLIPLVVSISRSTRVVLMDLYYKLKI